MDSSAIIEQMNRESRGTLMASLGIEFTGIGENWLEAKMPIDERTMRPGNLLHGGAIMALVEVDLYRGEFGGESRVWNRD